MTCHGLGFPCVLTPLAGRYQIVFPGPEHCRRPPALLHWGVASVHDTETGLAFQQMSFEHNFPFLSYPASDEWKVEGLSATVDWGVNFFFSQLYYITLYRQ